MGRRRRQHGSRERLGGNRSPCSRESAAAPRAASPPPALRSLSALPRGSMGRLGGWGAAAATPPGGRSAGPGAAGSRLPSAASGERHPRQRRCGQCPGYPRYPGYPGYPEYPLVLTLSSVSQGTLTSTQPRPALAALLSATQVSPSVKYSKLWALAGCEAR